MLLYQLHHNGTANRAPMRHCATLAVAVESAHEVAEQQQQQSAAERNAVLSSVLCRMAHSTVSLTSAITRTRCRN